MGNLIAPTTRSDPRDVALAVVLIRQHFNSMEAYRAVHWTVPWREGVHETQAYHVPYTTIYRQILDNAPNRAELEAQGLYEMLEAISDETVRRWGIYYNNDASSMFEEDTDVNCHVCNDLVAAGPDSWHYEGATGEYTFEQLMDGPFGREFWRRPADRHNAGAGASSLPPINNTVDPGTSLFGNRRFYN
jgi:hypothetical protein